MSLIPDNTEVTETPEATPEVVDATPEVVTDTKGGTETPDATYLYADGIAGEGEKPEWFKDSKYKTIGDQAQAYNELESKFGSFTGAPKDGLYEIEGVDFAENPLMDTVAKWGAEKGLSNEGLTELVGKVGELARTQQAEDSKAAMDALGETGQARINDIAQWGKNNLSAEEYVQFQGLVQTAGQVDVMEKLIGKTKNSKLVDIKETETASTRESKKAELTKMQLAEDGKGRRLMEVDSAYRKKVTQLQKEFNGE